MSATKSPQMFQKWAAFFAGRKPGDVITPDDINHAKRIVWHAKAHGFGAMIRSTESGKPIVHLTRLTPEITAVSERAPEPMTVASAAQSKPTGSVLLPLPIAPPDAPRNALWDKITEHAKNAYNAFTSIHGPDVHVSWDSVLHEEEHAAYRLRRFAVGAYIVSVGGAK